MHFSQRLFFSILAALILFSGCAQVDRPINRSNFQDRLPEVTVFAEIETTMGVIQLELYRNNAPITVQNFIDYAEAGFYEGTIFHRVISDFVVQGGGLTVDLTAKETRDSILNEASNGLRNERGTIAMARSVDRNSATSQFYFNLKHNESLDHGVRNYGYAVFGRVTEGMDVIEAIAGVPTATRNGMRDVPVDPVLINSVRILGRETVHRGPVLPDRRR